MLGNFLRRKALVVGMASMAAVALVVSACGDGNDDLEDRVAAIEEQLAGLQTTLASSQTSFEGVDDLLRTVNVMVGIGVLQGVEFHHVDTTIQSYTKVDTEFLSTLRNARRITRSAAWPHSLQVDADALVAALHDVEDAFDANDLAQLKSAASVAHTSFHVLESNANELLEGEVAGDDHDHDDSGGDDDDHMSEG